MQGVVVEQLRCLHNENDHVGSTKSEWCDTCDMSLVRAKIAASQLHGGAWQARGSNFDNEYQ